MSLTYSSMLDLHTDLIAFNLPNVVTEKHFSNHDLDISKPTIIMFICNHCPYVIHYHEEIVKLAVDFKNDVNLVAISSNDIINYPQDRPEKMKNLWNDLGLSFPYLFDETQEIAKAYSAVCTPDIFLYNNDRELEYRGRLDDNWKEPEKVSREELKMAIEFILKGEKIDFTQIPSMGCNIKWKN